MADRKKKKKKSCASGPQLVGVVVIILVVVVDDGSFNESFRLFPLSTPLSRYVDGIGQKAQGDSLSANDGDAWCFSVFERQEDPSSGMVSIIRAKMSVRSNRTMTFLWLRVRVALVIARQS